MGYCALYQNIEFWVSFLRSLAEIVQEPHTDIIPEDYIDIVSVSVSGKTGYRTMKCFKHEVSFITFFPLSEDGMKIKIWDKGQSEKGKVVFVPFKTLLVLRGDVAHAGGFLVGNNFDPRGHSYIYKHPHGVTRSVKLMNWYDTRDGKTRLETIYAHSDEVKVTVTPTAGKRTFH